MPTDRHLPPFPNGWYVVAFAHELPPGGVLERRFAGQDLVLFRTRSGRAVALDAYCPHLGAHLAYGGVVEGETIRCPFHGFRFDAEGACVATGYGTKPPPSAVAHRWPLREQNDLLLVYYDAEGRAPEWEVPAFDVTGWAGPFARRFAIASHPQETTENSVDLGHLSWVHGYKDVAMLDPLQLEGHILRTRYVMHRSAGALGNFGKLLRAEFAVTVHGLGYSQVEVEVPQYGMRTLQLVLPTPTDEERLDLRIVLYLDRLPRRAAIHPLLAVLPERLARSLVGRLTFNGYAHDVRQDFPMWEHKRYIQPPLLAKGDGPIGKYRTWTRQFYSVPVPMLEREPAQMEV